MRVVVANPVRQYSHHTAFALQEAGLLARYVTSIWYDRRRFPDRLVPLLPRAARRQLEDQLEKRSDARLDPRLVATYPAWKAAAAVLETARARTAPDRERRLFRFNRTFDAWAAGLLARLPADVFVGYEMACLESFEACRRRGIRCVLDLAAVHWRTQHRLFGGGGDAGEIERIKDREIALADLVLTPSTFAEQSLLDAGVAPARIARVPFGMDPDLFRMRSGPRPEGAFTVLYVGGITPRKGLETLLEAVARLSRSDLILVGGMDDGGGLLARYPGVARHLPFTRQEDLVPLYQRADAFVLPSRADSFGMVVLEAMACGAPVIVTETTGARDAVREGVDGYVVPVDDVEALRDRLAVLRDDRGRAQAMGRAAHERASAWSWSAYGGRLRAALSGCSREPGSAPTV